MESDLPTQRLAKPNGNRLKRRVLERVSVDFGVKKCHSGLRAAVCVPEVRRTLSYCVAGGVVRLGIFLKKIT